MKKSDFVSVIAEKANISKTKASVFLDVALDSIEEILKSGDEVVFTGFGKFYVVERPERPGHNPMTGAAITCPAVKMVRFSAGKTLKDAIQ